MRAFKLLLGLACVALLIASAWPELANASDLPPPTDDVVQVANIEADDGLMIQGEAYTMPGITVSNSSDAILDNNNRNEAATLTPSTAYTGA